MDSKTISRHDTDLVNEPLATYHPVPVENTQRLPTQGIVGPQDDNGEIRRRRGSRFARVVPTSSKILKKSHARIRRLGW